MGPLTCEFSLVKKMENFGNLRQFSNLTDEPNNLEILKKLRKVGYAMIA